MALFYNFDERNRRGSAKQPGGGGAEQRHARPLLSEAHGSVEAKPDPRPGAFRRIVLLLLLISGLTLLPAAFPEENALRR